MLIDWFTVAAQVINFLILVWLLKRFLYHPILEAIDAREQLIARELSEADAKKSEAARERADFERKNASFDRERASLLAQASAAANAERQRLLDAARLDASRLSARLQEDLQQQLQQQDQEISRRIRQEVFAIARKALGDLAGVRLEERMLAVLVERLQALSGEEKLKLMAALQATAKPLVVRSSFALTAAEQASAETAIRALLGADSEIRFVTAPDLLSGIELRTDGHKLAWSIDGYLTELENGIGELLKTKPPEQRAPEKTRTDAG